MAMAPITHVLVRLSIVIVLHCAIGRCDGNANAADSRWSDIDLQHQCHCIAWVPYLGKPIDTALNTSSDIDLQVCLEVARGLVIRLPLALSLPAYLRCL